MKKVMVFGTFDIFHEGHKNFFKQAKKFGDYLLVVVALDKTVMEVKGKYPKNGEQERMVNLMESELVNEAVLGYKDDKYRIIKEHMPDVICLGYDQQAFAGELKSKLKEIGKNIPIHKLKPYKPEIYKSSKLANTRSVFGNK